MQEKRTRVEMARSDLFLIRSRPVMVVEQVANGNSKGVGYSEETAYGRVSSALLDIGYVAALQGCTHSKIILRPASDLAEMLNRGRYALENLVLRFQALLSAMEFADTDTYKGHARRPYRTR